MYGCEIVCPPPIGRAASSYAWRRSSGGTKSSRGTRSIAARTRSSTMSRSRSWCCTIADRSASSDGTSERPLVRGRLQAEVLDHRRGDVDDGLRRSVDADCQHRDLRIAREERTVAPAADVMPPREIGE